MMGGASRFIILLTTPFPFLLHGPHHRPSLLGLARHSRHSRLPSSIYLAPLSTSYHLLTISPTSPRQLSFPVNAIHTRTSTNQEDIDSPGFPANSPAAHPWPEWSRLIDSLSSGGYFDHQRQAILIDDEFVAYEKFSDEFVRASSACLAFARDRSDILGLLSRTDISVVVENGTAFLFKSALDTARRMRAFLGNGAGNELDSNKAHTVDLMKYLLSYVSNPTVSSERSNMHTGELIESAVRNLLSEFTRLGRGVPAPESSSAVQHQFPDRYVQTPRPIGQNMEMKRGDWICPRCTFVNFARNVKCLECKEARPKRQLVGGEWECPQCDFVNCGKNLICLRCDCKRPGDASFGITNSSSVFGHGNGLYANKPDSASDLSNAAADEDFPEIMPLRKGVNRFVVSTRKTPLERKLANSQFQRDAANTVSSEILCRGDKNNVAHVKNAGTTSSPSMSRSTSPRFGHPKGSHSSYVPFVPLPNDMFAKNSEKIEENERVVTDTIHFASLKASEQTNTVSVRSETSNSEGSLHLTEKPSNEVEKSESWFKKVADLHDATEISDDFSEIMPTRKGENRFLGGTKKDRSLTSPMYKRRMAMEQTGSTTNFVPFVPFPPDYFAKKDNQQPNGAESGVKATGETSSDSDVNNACKVDNPQTSFRELNLESSGENLNKRKSSDTYGSPISGNPRQNSFDSQSNDKEGGLSTVFSGEEKRIERAKSSSGQNLNERGSHITYGSPIRGNPTQNSFNAQSNNKAGFFGTEKRIESTNLSSGENLNERKSHVTYGSPISGNPTQSSFDSLSNKEDGRSIGFSHKESRIRSAGFSGKESRIQSTDLSGSSTKQQENQSVGSGWTGKSLEGSAVQEPDPLDMSEEAKAQRWFRRVAQIKDISELSQIPDEDFPSIMPMRKGVNRFVVSKRKTPLERRLTSPQYRRNLPVVSMDQQKKENENS